RRPAADGRRGPRYTRDDRHDLEETDPHCLRVGDLGKIGLGVRVRLESLEQKQRDAAKDEGAEHHRDVSEEIAFDRLVYRETDDARGYERHDELLEDLPIQ